MAGNGLFAFVPDSFNPISCVDNLGQIWNTRRGVVFPSNQPGGIASLTCTFSIQRFSPPDSGTISIFLMQVYEISGVEPTAGTSSNGGFGQVTCGLSSSANAITLVSAYVVAGAHGAVPPLTVSFDPSGTAGASGSTLLTIINGGEDPNDPNTRVNTYSLNLLVSQYRINGAQRGPGTTISAAGASFPSISCSRVTYRARQEQQARVEATILDAAGNGTPVTMDISPNTEVTAQFPLGSQFRIRLLEKDGSGQYVAVTSSFSLSEFSSPGGLDTQVLFPQDIALMYEPGTSSTAKNFQAVHLGSILLTVTPPEGPQGAALLRLKIYSPQHLAGSDEQAAYDGLMVSLAQRHGVLPQFIKAHASKEGEFNPLAYRYEPLNPDVGDLAFATGPKDLRTVQPYSDYILPTIADAEDHISLAAPGQNDPCAKLPDANSLRDDPGTGCLGLFPGAFLLDQDVDARLHSVCGPNQFDCVWSIPERNPETGDIVYQNGEPVLRDIQPGELYISAKDIVDFNDGVYNWKRRARSAAASRYAKLRFTAQTSLAASYGLLQMTYVRAITEDWQGVGQGLGGRNPSYLFDTLANIEAGGGSLGVGTVAVRRKYRVTLPIQPVLSDYQALKNKFRDAYQKYNRNEDGYGQDVMDRSDHFLPIPDSDRPIFPGGSQ